MRVMRALLLTGLLTAAACGGAERERDGAAADSAAVEDATAAAALLSPVRAVSMAEVEFAQLGAQRAGSPALRQYAQTITADHRALIGTLDSVARLRAAVLAESVEARELANTVRMAHSGLETLRAPDFDLPFVRAEVESHRLLLDRLDQQLIPGATSADLRALLTDTRAMVDAHLTRARQLLAEQLGQAAEPAPPPVTRPPVRPPAPPDTTRPDTTPPPPDTTTTGRAG